MSRILRRATGASVLVLALVGGAANLALAGSYLRTGSPGTGAKALRWPGGKLRLLVPRNVHVEGDGGVDRRESAQSVHTAVWEAARAWNSTGRADVEITLELTDGDKMESGKNMVTFSDPKPFDEGLCSKELFVACTLAAFDEEGTIHSVTIAFNPYMKHSSIGIAGTHDIGLIMMHELGHAMGLDHSGLLDSVMAPHVELANAPPGHFPVRRLASDDVHTLAALYPKEGSQLATLSGKVTLNGEPVLGAHVVAVNSQGRAMASTLAEADGSWKMMAPAGSYRLVAEPLDGPVHLRQMTMKIDGRTDFGTRWWAPAQGASPQPVEVAEAETKANLDIAVTPAAELNLDTIGPIENGLYAGTPRAVLGIGNSYMLAVTRTPVGLAGKFVIPESVAVTDGAASSPSAAPQLVRQRVVVKKEAEAGAYVLEFSTEKGMVLLPGALWIAPSPKIEGVEMLPESRRLVVKGTGLASAASQSEPWEAGALPPTQLSGVAVRLDARFLPLLAVSPTEIVAELPEGLSASGGNLSVVTGASGEGSSLKVP